MNRSPSVPEGTTTRTSQEPLERISATRHVGRATGLLAVFLLTVWPGEWAGDSLADEIGNTHTSNIVRIDGPVLRGRLVSVEEQWKFTFASDKKRSTVIAGKKLVRWAAVPQAGRGTQILLRDGGRLIAEPLAIGKDHIQVQSELFGEIRLPRTTVRGVIFSPPADRRQAEQLTARIAGKTRDDKGDSNPATADRLILVNGDQLSGEVQSLATEVITLRNGGTDVPIELTKVAALALGIRRKTVARPKSLHAMIGLSDGSRLLAESLLTASLMSGGERATLRLFAGPDISCQVGQIRSIQMFGALATYLSDLKPASYRHAAYLKVPWNYQADRSVTGLALRCGKSEYLKGLGMHSASRITYRLDKPYRRLEAELGIDDDTQGMGSVVFRVFIDDRSGKWKLRYTSPTIRGGDAPTPVSVDLSGARQISLLVDFADRGDEMDHADWLDARLVP